MTKTKTKTKTTKLPTFEVDKEGLAKVAARRGRAFVVLELFQNAVDEDGVTKVDVQLIPAGGDHGYQLVVTDDSPEGFADLSHAYTLYAESKKKEDETKRGRFDLGEKLVVALCDTATVSTTKGTVSFRDGGRYMEPEKREQGSEFRGHLEMGVEDVGEAERLMGLVIVPDGIAATYNGEPLKRRKPVRTFRTELRSEKADDEGKLRPTRRVADVCLYKPAAGERPTLFELGLPVVEAECAWHVDVRQKVPLSVERDNVTPGWLRDLRAEVLNAAHDILTPDQADAKWIDDGLADERAKPEAAAAVVKGRYGDKAVATDPSDPEGQKIAVTKGYTVIPSGAFSKEVWMKVRESGVAPPAGQVTPSPKPDQGDDAASYLDESEWSEPVRATVEHAKRIAFVLLGVDDVTVRIANDALYPYAATYGPSAGLTLNRGRLGEAWFETHPTTESVALLLHEFAHHAVSDHLSHEFHGEVGRLGAKLALLAAEEPTIMAVAVTA